MIPLPSETKIWLAAGIIDMRNGFNGLAVKVQTALKDDPMSGHVFPVILRCILAAQVVSGSRLWLPANPGHAVRCYQV